MSLYQEIFEQAEVAERILQEQRENIERIARGIRERNPDTVFLAARGTSDNAGRYINYLWGAFNRVPVALATPSLFSIYQQPPVLHNTLVIGISQSGKSPDIVSVLAEARKQGVPTLTITNAPGSPLSVLADWEIDICAGVEKAVAATKTYTASMMAAAMLSCALGEDNERWDVLSKVPGWMREVMGRDEVIARIAERYRFMEQCVVLGRGFNYSTAFEWSLKMKELCYVMADPYSSADFQHGPIALVEQGFPVMAVAPQGKVLKDLLGLMELLCEERKVELLTISNDEDALSLAQSAIRLPIDMPEWVSPIVSIIPAQLFAYYLTLAKGFDT